MDNNDQQVAARKNEYKRRQAIVEHPFGTIKRQWGYTHTLMKGIEKVKGEFSIILLCYNLKRAIRILGLDAFKKALLSQFNGYWVSLAYIKRYTNIFVFLPRQLLCQHTPCHFYLN